jgi:hypothetical protein
VTDSPADWRLDVPPDRIELYLQVSAEPRPLTAAEATMLVELVDAWRRLEQRKHIALARALSDRPGPAG